MTNLMHFEIVSLELALPHITAGSVKPLAVMTDKRVADLPDVPTIAEAGFPEATYVPWYGIYVQAGTPDAIVGKINDGINKALQNPEVQRQLAVANIPGKPMPLAVFTENRIADLPDVPTIAEAGYPGASYVSWYGIYVPSATPVPLAEKINQAISKALLNPDVQRQLAVADIPGKPMSLTELAALMKADHDKLTAVVKASGMTAP